MPRCSVTGGLSYSARVANASGASRPQAASVRAVSRENRKRAPLSASSLPLHGVTLPVIVASAPLRSHEVVERLRRRLPAAVTSAGDDAVEVGRSLCRQFPSALEPVQPLLAIGEQFLVAGR